MKQPAVYIVANKPNGTFFIGVTSNLGKRVWEHKENLIKGFTQKYNVHQLVYFEVHDNMYFAMTREKQIKKWRRAWKIRLIKEMNPNWDDLFESLF